MDERIMEGLLYDLLSLESKNYADEELRISSFEEVGMLTRDRGLVVRDDAGAEFQITITRR